MEDNRQTLLDCFPDDRYGEKYVARKLKANWTPEMAQDLMAYHGIDAQAELEQLLAREINNVITEQIIEGLNNNG